MDTKLNVTETLYMAIRTVVIMALCATFSCSPKRTDALEKYKDGKSQILAKGIISTDTDHESIAFISKNHDEIIFTRSSRDFKTSSLYHSSYKGEWTEPKKILLSGNTYEAGLAFSPDMKKAFFTNKMPIEDKVYKDQWNIWQVDALSTQDFRTESAKPLTGPINSDNMECCLTMNSNGTTLFSSNRDGSWDIYEATYSSGVFKNIKKLDQGINSDQYDEWPSFINDEETIILFSSIRKDGIGGDDIYYVKNSKGGWSEPELFNESFNSAFYEDGAIIAPDKNYFLFSSWKPSLFSKDVSNIYIKRIENELK
ncbi:MAG: hypothetical protein Tsb004_15530 [Allomuricauda sp.]